ncbi:MAG: hypothetical protein H6Q28_381, partial [Bacteroidetes bacterium]|nr:hypothetical protein [Bacteroidota bacterium]
MPLPETPLKRTPQNRAALLLLCLSFAFAATPGLIKAQDECTTAIITGAGTVDGRPLLWKNRDTDDLSNKVVFVDDVPHKYLGVVNAADTSGRITWGGLNDAGFAIINTVAYNLPKSGGLDDLEGHVMGDALRTCATVDDFEQYLKRNLGPGLGSWTNYCVIDARGGAAIFETHNKGYVRLPADTAVGGCLLNTNFSRSGRANEGAGYLRFDREERLFGTISPGGFSRDFILQTAARDLGHPLLLNPEPETWKNLPADRPYWVHTNHTINRSGTASTVLIHGAKPGQDPSAATLWVILGEPVCSIALPLWVAAGQTPPQLREGKDAPIAAEALRLRKILHPLPGSDRSEYADITRLDNSAGTGWLPGLKKTEREIFAATDELLLTSPTPRQLADFQITTTARALT